MSFLISATRQKPRPAPKERWHKWPATPLTWQFHSCFRGSNPTNCSRGSQLISTKFLLLVASEWWFICGNLRFKLTYFLPGLYFKAHDIMSWPRAHASPTQPWLHLWRSLKVIYNQRLQDKMDATGRSTPWGLIPCIYPVKKSPYTVYSPSFAIYTYHQ